MKREIYDYEKEQKKAEKRKRWNDRKAKAANWVWRNRNWIVPLVPVVVSGGFATAKVVGKRANLHKEEEVKKLYCYDRSLGHYWALRRELTNDEWLEIEKRKANGERLADILEELKVLK